MAYKFKVGDKVKVRCITSPGWGGSTYDGHRLNGRIGIITEIKWSEYYFSNQDKPFVLLDIEQTEFGSHKSGIWCDDLKLIEKIPPKPYGIVKFMESINAKI